MKIDAMAEGLPAAPSGVQQSVDDSVFERAWRAVQLNLVLRARHLTKGDQTKAEELIASTALKTLLYMRQMPTRIRDPESFIFMVLNHVFIDSLRHAKRERCVMVYASNPDEDYLREVEAPTSSPAQAMELREGLLAVASIVEKLPAEQQELFELKFEKDLPYAVISDRLNISQALARKRVEQLRKKLRDGAAYQTE